MPATRTETDSFGPIEVPADRYWGAQTARSIANFPFGVREAMPIEIVRALGYVKQAAARVNARIGGLDPAIAEAVGQAAAEVAVALHVCPDDLVASAYCHRQARLAHRHARQQGGLEVGVV